MVQEFCPFLGRFLSFGPYLVWENIYWRYLCKTDQIELQNGLTQIGVLIIGVQQYYLIGVNEFLHQYKVGSNCPPTAFA